MIWLAHLYTVKYVRDPVEHLIGGVLRLSKHSTGVSHQGPRQPGGQLPHVGGHGGALHLVLQPDIGQGRHQLVQGIIRATEGWGKEEDCENIQP